MPDDPTKLSDSEKYTLALAFAFQILSDKKTSRGFTLSRYGKPMGPYVYLDDATEAVRKAWVLSKQDRPKEVPDA